MLENSNSDNKAAQQRLAAVIRLLGFGDDTSVFLPQLPVQLAVWELYAQAPDRRQRLILHADARRGAGWVADRLRKAAPEAATRIAAIQGLIIAQLSFDEFATLVLPRLLVWDRTRSEGEHAQGLISHAGALCAAISSNLGPAFAPSPDKYIHRVAPDRSLSTPGQAGGLTSRDIALRSCETVKADAARRLFNVSCQHIRWAVLDSGVAKDHPALTNRMGGSRVVASYNFVDLVSRITAAAFETDDASGDRAAVINAAAASFGAQLELNEADAVSAAKACLSEFAGRLKRGLDIDWDIVEQLALMPQPPSPADSHGTDVALCMAADWRHGDPDYPGQGAPIEGMCPDLELVDIRLIHPETRMASEFDLIAALNFLRFKNQQAKGGHPFVHGVNISLATAHDVLNYGCGSTPACVACDELVASGAVVVVAAGNSGFARSSAKAVDTDGIRGLSQLGGGGYADISIADPGNAQQVITVGSTHAHHPHRYGISWFSSRGPTADGRAKPDLIAPGERILSLANTAGVREVHGTSYAAPHVSGAAAMLLARHPELIGRPDAVKRALCATATDLGRDRAFQGAGLLDVLRALQSL
jgi:serine protease AprX